MYRLIIALLLYVVLLTSAAVEATFAGERLEIGVADVSLSARPWQARSVLPCPA